MNRTPTPPRDNGALGQSPTWTQLLALFWLLGLIPGLILRDLVETAGVSPRAAPGSASSSGASVIPAGTTEVIVHLSLPTEVPTATRTPEPPATLGAVGLDFCGAVTRSEGAICRMPMPTGTATATFPACWSPQAEAGKLCQLRSATPAATAVGTAATRIGG